MDPKYQATPLPSGPSGPSGCPAPAIPDDPSDPYVVEGRKGGGLPIGAGRGAVRRQGAGGAMVRGRGGGAGGAIGGVWDPQVPSLWGVPTPLCATFCDR